MLETEAIRNTTLCKLHKVPKGLSSHYHLRAWNRLPQDTKIHVLKKPFSGWGACSNRGRHLSIFWRFPIPALNHRAPNAVILTSISKRNSRFASTPATSGAGNSFRYDATSWRVLFLSAKQTQIRTKLTFWSLEPTYEEPTVIRHNTFTVDTYERDPKCCSRASLVSILAMLLMAKPCSSGKYLNTAR